ncbi:MAG: heme-binding domain-containing protein [Ardenticatenaceae bacterium]|nr:heme-binding domain-containing protein [Anaerolineales bacterium]MCB8920173.1 heme-binding domain-containing protein [Ardenticatenaceae bacterium]
MKKLLKISLWVIIGGFVLIQLVPYGRNHTNPSVIQEPNWDSPETRALAQRACFDCHSNETVWPWYANVAPVSWLTQHDVDDGRRHLNFSDWLNNGRINREKDEIAEVIQRGDMPPAVFLIMHSEARLTDAEKQQLIQGLMATTNN